MQGNGVSRNHAKMKSESDEALEEWSHIFKMQHNRWQDEFDDLKAQFLTDFEKQKLLKKKQVLPKAKPKASFEIPNEYLSLDKRTVKEGEEGKRERLRRDRIKARRIRRHSQEGIESEDGEDTIGSGRLNHDVSVMTI